MWDFFKILVLWEWLDKASTKVINLSIRKNSKFPEPYEYASKHF